MRHRRDYADVSGLDGGPTDVGFLGTPYALGLSPGNLFDFAVILTAAYAIYFGMG